MWRTGAATHVLVLKHYNIYLQDSQPSIAPQPVGYTAGLKGCEERVQQLRQSPRVHEQQVLVAVENFIVEVFPEK